MLVWDHTSNANHRTNGVNNISDDATVRLGFSSDGESLPVEYLYHRDWSQFCIWFLEMVKAHQNGRYLFLDDVQ